MNKCIEQTGSKECNRLAGIGSCRIWMLAGIWLVGTAASFIPLLVYKGTPGDRGSVAAQENLEPRHLPRLMMFVHPHCTCSRASMTEFAGILRCQPNQISAEVVFVIPRGSPAGWERSDLWTKASSVPGVVLRRDEAGKLARELGIKTSGHVILRDEGGRLEFSGGITSSRGHVGGNLGRAALLSLMAGTHVREHEFPVFGCPLFAAELASEESP